MTTSDVSRQLGEILDMAARLEARAIDAANDPSGIVGGEAMVNLAAVANLADWGRRNDLASDALLAYEDPDELWSPFQMLAFWSESWRVELGMDHDDPRWRPSIATEAAFLRNPDVLAWAWDNELHFDDFAADVGRARTKLENVLVEGERAERGVPCMYDECRGARIVRKVEPARGEDGAKVWRWSDWHCPRCHRKWTEVGYAAMVVAANEAAKVEDIDGRIWCTVEYAARKVERSPRTIRTWMTREHLTVACMIAGRRLPFVSLEEVVELAQTRAARKPRKRTEAGA